MRYPIKTLGIGGIIDVTVNLIKNHFSLFMGIMLTLYLPFVVILNVVLLATQPELSPEPTQEEMQAFTSQMAVYGITAGGLGILFALLIQPLATASATYAVANEYLGIPTTLGDSVRQGLRSFLSVAWVWILTYILCMLGLLALIIPGVYLFFSFSLASEVVVIEKIKGWAALKRSYRLMRHPGSRNVTKMFGLMMVVWMISFGINLIAGLIPEIYVRLAISILVQSVLMIFTTTAFVVFYFSARCEAENFDLAFLASSIGADEPVETDDVWEAAR
ncbi:MAG: hypothetical protein U1D30_20665 [Planctomycetota bacterium]